MTTLTEALLVSIALTLVVICVLLGVVVGTLKNIYDKLRGRP